jgi:hypothetical protein
MTVKGIAPERTTRSILVTGFSFMGTPPGTMSTLKTIAQECGQYYISNFLIDQQDRVFLWGSDYTTTKPYLTTDAYSALLFFFARSFARGRSDELSHRFYIRTRDTLTKEHFSSLILTRPSQWDHALCKLRELLKTSGVNNHKDRDMVTDTLHFLRSELSRYDYNIITYTLSEIRLGQIGDVETSLVFKELSR